MLPGPRPATSRRPQQRFRRSRTGEQGGPWWILRLSEYLQSEIYCEVLRLVRNYRENSVRRRLTFGARRLPQATVNPDRRVRGRLDPERSHRGLYVGLDGVDENPWSGEL